MEDFEKVGDALSRESSYVASLARSMSLAMEEFYKNLRRPSPPAAGSVFFLGPLFLVSPPPQKKNGPVLGFTRGFF